MVERLLKTYSDSFFLFGPRGVGKSTWVSRKYKDELKFDLLNSRHFLEFSRDPSLLAAKVAHLPHKSWVIIDEIQKLPILLDEAHRLIEEKKIRFIFTGSSARKLKRTGANLLAGRAVTRNMFQLTSQEWIGPFSLKHALEWGGLPLALTSEKPSDFLQSYFFTYLKEEIQEEGFVRNIEPFIRFLEIAAHYNGQILNVENMARETGSKRVTLDSWFSILEDTLVGFRLPPWRPQIKVRETAHPKFYWFDPGVARAAAGLLNDQLESSWLGYALETWVLHEVRAYNSYSGKNRNLFYYNLPSDRDIDLIVETKKTLPNRIGEVIGIEIKFSSKWRREWEAPLRDLKSSQKVKVKKMIGLYRGQERLTFDDFDVMPIEEFFKALHAGEIF